MSIRRVEEDPGFYPTGCRENQPVPREVKMLKTKEKTRIQRAPSRAHYSTDHVRVLVKLSWPKCRDLGRHDLNCGHVC